MMSHLVTHVTQPNEFGRAIYEGRVVKWHSFIAWRPFSDFIKRYAHPSIRDRPTRAVAMIHTFEECPIHPNDGRNLRFAILAGVGVIHE